MTAFNVDDRQFCIFRKGSGPWHLPFLIPDEQVQKLPLYPFQADEKLLEVRVLPSVKQRKIALFFRLREKTELDFKFRFHLRSRGQQYYYFAHWANGILLPELTPENVWFAVELPFPPGWQTVEDLRIHTTRL